MGVLPGVDPESERSQRTGLMLAGLANPRRMMIVRHVLISGSQYPTELVRAGLGAMATVSAALQDLVGRGVLDCLPHGFNRLYALADGVKLPPRDSTEWGGVRCGSVDVYFPLVISGDGAYRVPPARRAKPRTAKGNDHAA